MTIGISLGWNCYPASYGVDNGLRKTKSNGYRTCPFDLMTSNYEGVVQCIQDNFEFFTDVKVVRMSPDAENNPNQRLICNGKYKFIFNHESPDHANLYLHENWPTGKEYFVENNFSMFRERYNQRIENFRSYMDCGERIIFLIARHENSSNELDDVIRSRWPNTSFEIQHLSLKNDPHCSVESFYSHHRQMKTI